MRTNQTYWIASYVNGDNNKTLLVLELITFPNE